MTQACRSFLPRLSAWFDGEAAELEVAEVRRHLLACPGCRATVSAWGGLRDDLAALQPAEPAPATLHRLALRFEEGLAAEVTSLARGLRWWNAAAAAALLIAAGSLVLDRAFPPGPVLAHEPRDIEKAVQEILQRPSSAALAAPAPAPSGPSRP